MFVFLFIYCYMGLNRVEYHHHQLILFSVYFHCLILRVLHQKQGQTMLCFFGEIRLLFLHTPFICVENEYTFGLEFWRPTLPLSLAFRMDGWMDGWLMAHRNTHHLMFEF